MTNLSEVKPATFESVWASLQETDRISSEKFAEVAQLFKESDQRFERSRIEAEKSRIETDRKFEQSRIEAEKSRIEAEKRMKKLEELIGSWSNNHGLLAEEYFLNSFEQNEKNFFGEKFDKIKDHVKGIKDGFEDEYDILLFNGKSIGIVEIKFKAHLNDVPKILRKAETFSLHYS